MGAPRVQLGASVTEMLSALLSVLRLCFSFCVATQTLTRYHKLLNMSSKAVLAEFGDEVLGRAAFPSRQADCLPVMM